MSKEWIPTPKQAIALASTADETLFGGARAGGKTEAALAWFSKIIEHPEARGLVLRRNGVDLDDFIRRAMIFFSGAGIQKRGNPVELIFPSGCVIYTGHLSHPDSFERFQGWEIHRLLIEELTHIKSEALYEKLLASVRSTVKGIEARVFLTTNPGGYGHIWVKKRFHIGDVAGGTKFTENGRTKVFVSAGVYDNKHILEKDPDYVKRLESLDDVTKAQWLLGSWDDFVIEGAYYLDEIQRARKQSRICELPVDPNLPTFSFWDLGVADATVIITIQIHPDGWFHVIDCYHKTKGSIPEFAHYLTSLAQDLGFRYTAHFLPHDGGNTDIGTGQKREVMLRKELGTGRVNIIKRTRDVNADIAITRTKIPKCKFDKKRATNLVEGLENYHAKFNEETQAFSQKPLHDWSSDYADAFRCFAVAHQQGRVKHGRDLETTSWGY